MNETGSGGYKTCKNGTQVCPHFFGRTGDSEQVWPTIRGD